MGYLKYMFILLLFPAGVWGQQKIVYNRSFTDLLDKYNLTFKQPEAWFKLQPLLLDDFATYALVIRSEDPAIEIRICYIPNTPGSHTLPNFDFTRLLTNISSNEHMHMLFLKGIDSTELKQIYHADWGGIATFKPKSSFSEMERAKLLSIFNESAGTIQIIYLYNGSSAQIEPYLDILSFGEQNSG